MGKKIIIIDDDADLSAQMVEVLRDEGHQVCRRLYTHENLPDFKPDDYDVIVLDFKMPDLSGIDILKSISKKDFKAKIFIVTGRPFIEKILNEENLLCMVSEIINKPFSIRNLLDKINNS